MITCGVDIGSRAIKIVLFDGKNILDSAVTLGGAAPKENTEQTYIEMLAANHMTRSDVALTIATGYGRDYFELADQTFSEITCHTAGASFLPPKAKTIIDIGAQESKIIRVSDQGNVADFVVNDRCAAGSGKFIEMVAQTLNIPVDEIGQAAQSCNEICQISSMCAMFAESEIISMQYKGVPTDVILRGIFHSVAKRIISLGNKVGFHGPIVLTGGVAQNSGVHEALRDQLGNPTIIVPHRPQLTGALGAAIIGHQTATKL